jgi:glycosyltransferase involved in cell wall biosynthesis
MRIAFLCTSGLDNASPRGRWLPVARELARRGHEPHLLLLHPTFDQLRDHCERELIIDGVCVSTVAQMHVYGLPGQRRYFSPPQLAVASMRAATALTRCALQIKPDAIHVCKPQPINGLAGWIASRRLGIPLYVDCDDYEAEANRFGSAWQRRLVAWWEDHLPPRAAGVTVNTRFMYRRLAQLGVSESRMAYVPNGVSLNESATQFPRMTSESNWPQALLALRDQPTVIYLGTLSTIAHGVNLLLDAFALVLADSIGKHKPSARLLMVGDGDDRAALQDQAQRLGIASSITWIGRVSPEDAPRYFWLARCSVDPVYDTPAMRARSPLKIVESLAAGVPVVTGDVGDRREMLANGEAGVLVEPGNAQALADGISHLLYEADLRERLAEGARRQSENYRWSKLVQGWLRLIGL